jgi:CDGSH-type Zn-finger protein
MARVIIHTQTGPRKIDETDIDGEKRNVAICQCGLSGEYPFCDGTHRVTRDEPDGTLFQYDDRVTARRAVRVSDVDDRDSDVKRFNQTNSPEGSDE